MPGLACLNRLVLDYRIDYDQISSFCLNIAAGSIASGVQSVIGNVSAESVFASVESLKAFLYHHVE